CSLYCLEIFSKTLSFDIPYIINANYYTILTIMDNLAVLFDVECPVHMGPLERGKILPCGHEICRSCLLFLASKNRRRLPSGGLADVIVCPTSRSWSLRRASNVDQESNVRDVLAELTTVESYCDEAIEKLDEMIVGLIGQFLV
uniref:RING-type domain-containing protein n=1 Tax=Romanomermis culicivorax TaxID=13658 RepID=A0A915IHZ2_ROMCU